VFKKIEFETALIKSFTGKLEGKILLFLVTKKLIKEMLQTTDHLKACKTRSTLTEEI